MSWVRQLARLILSSGSVWSYQGTTAGSPEKNGTMVLGKKKPKPQTQYIMATGTQRFLPGAGGKERAKPYDKVPGGTWFPWVNMPKCVWTSLPSGRTEGKVFLDLQDTSRDMKHIATKWWLSLTGNRPGKQENALRQYRPSPHCNALQLSGHSLDSELLFPELSAFPSLFLLAASHHLQSLGRCGSQTFLQAESAALSPILAGCKCSLWL